MLHSNPVSPVLPCHSGSFECRRPTCSLLILAPAFVHPAHRAEELASACRTPPECRSIHMLPMAWAGGSGSPWWEEQTQWARVAVPRQCRRQVSMAMRNAKQGRRWGAVGTSRGVVEEGTCRAASLNSVCLMPMWAMPADHVWQCAPEHSSQRARQNVHCFVVLQGIGPRFLGPAFVPCEEEMDLRPDRKILWFCIILFGEFWP